MFQCIMFFRSNDLYSCASRYVCVTDGCPDKGATEMACKQGYEGPLCAVCKAAHFKQVRECIPCQEPQWTFFITFIFGLCLLALVARYATKHYSRYVKSSQAFSHFKIFVSFITVMSTVSTQFGIVWPVSFVHALDGLSVLSFDFGLLAGESTAPNTEVSCVHHILYLDL